jgi:hypothetical protein
VSESEEAVTLLKGFTRGEAIKRQYKPDQSYDCRWGMSE